MNNFLADSDKTHAGVRTYKARHFNWEPGCETRLHDITDMDSQLKTIAVVDDDPGVRQCLDKMLTIAGYRVFTFATGEDFLGGIPHFNPGCVVLDVGLGRMSGLDLARHPDVSLRNLPIIFMSGTLDDSLSVRAQALGCIAFLRKPFKSFELLDAIFRATESSIPIP